MKKCQLIFTFFIVINLISPVFLQRADGFLTGVTFISDLSSPQVIGSAINFTSVGVGGTGDYEYEFRVKSGDTWSVVQDYSSTSTWQWDTVEAAAGTYYVGVYARNAGSTARYEAVGNMKFGLVELLTGVTFISDLSSPQVIGSAINFTAVGVGGTGDYEYEFRVKSGDTWSVVQDYSSTSTWQWDTAEAATGTYYVGVYTRKAGSTARYEAVGNMKFVINQFASAYYIDSIIGGNCMNYDPVSRECGNGAHRAFTTIENAFEYINDTETIIIMPGYYLLSEPLDLYQSEKTITGNTGFPVDVFIDCSQSGNCISVSGEKNIFKNITFTNSSSQNFAVEFVYVGDYNIIENCLFLDNSKHLKAYNIQGLNIKNSNFLGTTEDTRNAIRLENCGSYIPLQISYSTFRPSNNYFSDSLYLKSTDLNFFNNYLTGSRNEGIYIYDDETKLYVANSVVFANGTTSHNGGYNINGACSQTIVENSMTRSFVREDYNLSINIDNINPINGLLGIKNYSRYGFLG